MKEFNIEKFKEEFEQGDLNGLEYLEETIIKDMKDKIQEDNKKGVIDFTREEYITSLFEAVMYLNNCEIIYETSDIKNKFNFDYYAYIRDLLFEELNIDLEELENE